MSVGSRRKLVPHTSINNHQTSILTPLNLVFVVLLLPHPSNKKTWGAEGGGSGPCSSLDQTAIIRSTLPALIRRYNITSLLDSSCGSMHWMPLVLRQVQAANKDFRFMGTDVVCSLITKHKSVFANETNWNFQVRCLLFSVFLTKNTMPLPNSVSTTPISLCQVATTWSSAGTRCNTCPCTVCTSTVT